MPRVGKVKAICHDEPEHGGPLPQSTKEAVRNRVSGSVSYLAGKCHGERLRRKLRKSLTTYAANLQLVHGRNVLKEVYVDGRRVWP